MKPLPRETALSRGIPFFLTLTSVGLTSLTVNADEFRWREEIAGDFSDPNRWLVNGSPPDGRVPGSGDIAIIIAGTNGFYVGVSGQSVQRLEATSGVTFSMGGSLTAQELQGSPIFLGSGTLTAGTWDIGSADLVDAVLQGVEAQVGSFTLPGSGHGLTVASGARLTGNYLHRPGAQGPRPLTVNGSGAEWNMSGPLSGANLLAVNVRAGGKVTLASVDDGVDFAVEDGTLNVSGDFKPSRLLLNGGTASSGHSQPTHISGATIISSGGTWTVAGLLTVTGRGSLPAVQVTDSGTLQASNVLLQDFALIDVGEPDKLGTMEVGGTLRKTTATLRVVGGRVTCDMLDCAPGSHSLGQPGLIIAAGGQIDAGSFLIDCRAELTSNAALVGRDGTVGDAASAQLVLDNSNALAHGSMVIGRAANGFVSLENGSRLQSPQITLGAEAAGTGFLFYNQPTVWQAGETDIVLGKAGVGTLRVAQGTVELGFGHLTLAQETGSQEIGSRGTIEVTLPAGVPEARTVLDASNSSLIVGGQGEGVVTVTGGELRAAAMDIGDSASDNRVTISGPEPQPVNALRGNLAVRFGLSVGNEGRGNLTLLSGARAVSDNTTAGDEVGSFGRIIIEQGCRLIASGNFICGDKGAGNVSVRGLLTADSVLWIGLNDGAEGLINVTGADADMESQREIVLCADGTAAQATLNVQAGGNVKCRGFGFICAPGPQGSASVNVSGAGSDLTLVQGDMTLGRRRGRGTTALTVSDGASVNVPGRLIARRGTVITITGGARMNVGVPSAIPPGVLRVGSGGGMINGGRIIGHVEIGAGASLEPGSSPGTLEVEGALTCEAGSNLTLEIAGTTAEVSHDMIQTTGALSVSGAVELKFIDGFAPAAGQTFGLISAAGGLTWTPQQVTVSGLAPEFNYTMTPSAGGLTLTADTAGTATTLPELEVEPNETTVTLLWPAATAWIPESNRTLGSSPGWQTVTPAPTGADGFLQVTLPREATGFFRLRRP